ncbi:MAG: hypothetical protein UIG59_01475 [Acutalibacteraceae bacterium]|nr:hypothetical protein [Acutalibacteraceae bacterium]
MHSILILAAATVVITAAATVATAVATVTGGETIVSATANEQKNNYKNPRAITRETTHLC